MKAYIYIIKNLINGKTYIGKTTKTVQERFDRHVYISSYNKKKTYLQKALNKYGRESFTVEILEEVVNDNLNEREKHWISELKPHYNLTEGGEGGDMSKSPNFILSVKNRDVKGCKNPMYGKKRNIPKEQLNNAHAAATEANKCPVQCEGQNFDSVGSAQLAYPGISIRKRLDNPRYPQFFRLKPKICRR